MGIDLIGVRVVLYLERRDSLELIEISIDGFVNDKIGLFIVLFLECPVMGLPVWGLETDGISEI